jgi:hypothetical protein
VTSSRFANDSQDIAIDTSGGDIETELTGDAAQAQQRASDIVENNPAVESIDDVAVGDGTASVAAQAQREFEREQALEETISESRFADDAGDVAVSFDGDEAETSLTESAAAAREQAQQIIDDNPAADSLSDLTVDAETGSAAITDEAVEQFEREQERRLNTAAGLTRDTAAADANRQIAAIREQQQEQRQELRAQQQAETRADVSQFGQQQLDALRQRGGLQRDVNPLADDLVTATEDVARGETIGGIFRNPLDDLISAAETAERDPELVDSATSGGLFAETDAGGGDLSAVFDPTDSPDGSVITGVTGVSEEDLARDTGLSEDLDEFIESAGETPPEEGGRPPSEERFGEQVVEGTATAASAIVNPEFLARTAERAAEIADPETVGRIADDPADAVATALDVGGETAVESAEQFTRDPGTAVGGAVFTGLTAGAAGAATTGRSALSSATVRDAVSAELDPRIGPFGTTAETSIARRIRGDGGGDRPEPDGGQLFADDDVTEITAADIVDDPLATSPNDADRRQDRRRSAQPPDVDPDTGFDREQPRTVSRRDTTAVDVAPGERSRSGPTQSQREAGRSRRTSTFDIDLTPRERQIAAQQARPDRDFRVRPEVRFDDDLSVASRSGAPTPTLTRSETAAGVGAGASVIEGAQQRQEQAEAVLPGVDERTAVFDGIDTDAAIGPDIDVGVDTDPDVDSDVDTGVDADSRIDSRIDSRSLLDTDARVDPDLRDPSLRDPEQRDPEIRDPEQRDPEIRDPEFRDPDIRDPDLDRPVDEDDEEPLFPAADDDTAGVRDVEATLEGFFDTPTGDEGGIFR